MTEWRVRLQASARRHIEEIDPWWFENRPAAPGLFAEELRAALEHAAAFPLAGTAYPMPIATLDGVRRIRLPRSRYHLYYVLEVDRRLVRVLGVWHASQGPGPDLK